MTKKSVSVLQTSLDRSFQEQFAANRAAALVPGRFSYSINSVHPPQVLYTIYIIQYILSL
jgi:hypothetical protein